MKQPGNIAGRMRNAYPAQIEAEYRDELVRRPALAGELVLARIMRAIAEAVAEHEAKVSREREVGLREDAELPYDPTRALVLVQRALGGARVGYLNTVGDIDTDALVQRARAVDALATRVQVEIAESVPGIRTTSDPTVGYVLQQSWARENVGLIKSVDTDFFDDLAVEVADAVKQGKSTTALAALIQARTGVAESRAAFIARDQISKLNGKVVQQRQQGLGVKRYRWRTAGDERVRDSHRAHDGKIFEWSKPPPGTGHPGHDYNCRCFAEPIFDDEMLDDSPDDSPEQIAAQQEAERRVAARNEARARKFAEQIAQEARAQAATAERRASFMRELERQAQREQAAALQRAREQQLVQAKQLEDEVNAALSAKPGTVRLSNGATLVESPDGKTFTLTLPDGQKRLVSLEPA